MKWSDIPGWFDWESYYQSIVNRFDGGVLVEVGNYLGRSLCFLGDTVKRSGKPFHVVGVDWGLGSGPETYPNGTVRNNHAEAVQEGLGTLVGKLHRNVIDCGLGDVVTLVTADSVRASRLFADESLVFVFLDTCHDFENVRRDIIAWTPKVTAGGVISGDDYGVPGDPAGPVWPGVGEAVRSCFGDRFKHVPHDCWCYYKT